MTFLYIAVGILMMWLLVQLSPVPSLTYLENSEWEMSSDRWSNAKILDVRDASEYLMEHIPGSINISTGRLPIVWRKELSPEDVVIILSKNWLQRKKAARILARRGFKHLYAVKGCYLQIKKGSGSREHNCGY